MSRDTHTRALNVSMLIGGFLMPLGVFVTFAVLTRRSLNENIRSMVSAQLSTIEGVQQTSIHVNSDVNKRDERVLKRTLIQLVCFCIAWGPWNWAS